MRFDGWLLFASEFAARAAIATLRGKHVAVEPAAVVVRGGDVRFDVTNVWPAGFWEPTLIALGTLAGQAFSGQARAQYEPDEPIHPIKFRTALASIPGDPGEAGFVRLLVMNALSACGEPDAGGIARACRIVRKRDLTALAAIYDALPLAFKARLARVFVGRTEPAARRVLADIVAQAVDGTDPWADETERLVAGIRRGVVVTADEPATGTPAPKRRVSAAGSAKHKPLTKKRVSAAEPAKRKRLPKKRETAAEPAKRKRPTKKRVTANEPA